MAFDKSDQSTDVPGDEPILDLGEIVALISALSNYGTESDACYDAGAYLASCIMLGATMEGYLVILTSLFPKEAQQALRHLKKTKQRYR